MQNSPRMKKGLHYLSGFLYLKSLVPVPLGFWRSKNKQYIITYVLPYNNVNHSEALYDVLQSGQKQTGLIFITRQTSNFNILWANDTFA